MYKPNKCVRGIYTLSRQIRSMNLTECFFLRQTLLTHAWDNAMKRNETWLIWTKNVYESWHWNNPRWLSKLVVKGRIIHHASSIKFTNLKYILCRTEHSENEELYVLLQWKTGPWGHWYSQVLLQCPSKFWSIVTSIILILDLVFL